MRWRMGWGEGCRDIGSWMQYITKVWRSIPDCIELNHQGLFLQSQPIVYDEFSPGHLGYLALPFEISPVTKRLQLTFVRNKDGDT